MGKMAGDKVEKALGRLQRLLQEPPTDVEEPGMMLSPSAEEDTRAGAIILSREEVAALEEATRVLDADLRFEHLEKTLDTRMKDFVRDSVNKRDSDHVAEFMKGGLREPEERRCYFPVEFLNVGEKFSIGEVDLLPLAHSDVPQTTFWVKQEPPIGGFARVPVRGTHLGRMKDRAAPVVDDALRELRLALRQHRMVPEEQLRFRRADSYTFGDGLDGWQQHADVRWPLDLNEELTADPDVREALDLLAASPDTRLRKKAIRAQRWLEDAMLSVDPLKKVLFGFFALEALLGDKSEPEKGLGLAYRRAMLGVAGSGSFSDPLRTYYLYGKVRSAAVHGSDPPALPQTEVRNFVWDVRRALFEYLKVAAREGLGKRSAMLRYLRDHPDAERLREHLLDQDAELWGPYFTEKAPTCDSLWSWGAGLPGAHIPSSVISRLRRSAGHRTSSNSGRGSESGG
jgi:hypothetical protein